jgi:zinc protease
VAPSRVRRRELSAIGSGEDGGRGAAGEQVRGRAVMSRSRCLFAVCAAALALAADRAAATDYAERVVERTLSNGLKLILLEDHKSPVAVVQVYYRVGSRDDVPGKSGRAHLLEHMMFKGTPKTGPEEYSRIVQRNGGRTNAFTSRDRTTYFASIAADRIGVVLDLEADRMRNLIISEKLYEPEKQVVTEERRLRVDDDPNGALFEQLYATAFQAHPYRLPIIGWMSDIKQSTAQDLREFYDRFYLPNNAFVVMVGDFDAGEMADRLEQAFGVLAAGPLPPLVRSREPLQSGERRVDLRRQAKLPLVAVGHHVPNLYSADAAALELLSQILAGGKTSRLYQRLVYEDRVAYFAGVDYNYSALDPNLFTLYAQPLPGRDPGKIERMLLDEVRRLDESPPSDLEMRRAKNQIEAHYVFAQDSIFYQAMLLGDYEIAGDWRLIDRYLPALNEVTRDDLLRVARFYLVPRNRTVATLLPLGGGEEAP